MRQGKSCPIQVHIDQVNIERQTTPPFAAIRCTSLITFHIETTKTNRSIDCNIERQTAFRCTRPITFYIDRDIDQQRPTDPTPINSSTTQPTHPMDLPAAIDRNLKYCKCGRAQYIAYPKAVCICGQSPLDLEQAKRLEAEKQAKLKQAKELELELKREQEEKDIKEQAKAAKILYNSTRSKLQAATLTVKDKSSVRSFLKKKNQEGKLPNLACQKFYTKVDAAVHERQVKHGQALQILRKKEYICDRNKYVAVVRLKQNHFETEPFQRRALVSRYVHGEWVGTKPQSRVTTKEQLKQKQLARLRRRKAKEQRENKHHTFFEVVEEISGNPEEVEKQQQLNDRWLKYKNAQKLLQAAEAAETETVEMQVRVQVPGTVHVVPGVETST